MVSCTRGADGLVCFYRQGANRLIVHKENSDFDMGMEILCLLPCAPDFAPFRTIANDLEIPHTTIRSYLAGLRQLDLGVKFGVARGIGPYLSIMQCRWHKAIKAALIYYEKVYGDEFLSVEH